MRLIGVLYRLVDRGDTLVVIEHHPSMIASAEHIVELGPEGGDAGGASLPKARPAELAKISTATGKIVKALLAVRRGAQEPRGGFAEAMGG